MNIRRAAEGDLDRLVVLWLELALFHEERDERFALAPDAEEQGRAYLKLRMEDLHAVVYVAEEASEITGMVVAFVAERPPVFRDRSYVLLSDLVVTASHRRSGVGARLLEKALAWSLARGLTRVEARAALCNETSVAFWHKAGFKPYMESVAALLPS